MEQTIQTAQDARRRLLNTIFRVVVLVFLVGSIGYAFQHAQSITEFTNNLKKSWNGTGWRYLVAAVLLMPLNWYAETRKWQLLIPTDEKLGLARAFRAVCAGVAVSLFTPNRIGEYGGRILFLSPKNQPHGIMANLLGNAAQLLVIFAIGLPAAVIYFYGLPGQHPNWLVWMLAPALGATGLLAWAYFNISLIGRRATQWPMPVFLKETLKKWQLLQHCTPKQLSDVLYWALLRFTVYTLQYWFFLLYFGVQTQVLTAIAGIATLYLLQTSLPLPPFMGLLTRGNLAIQIWAPFHADPAACLGATFGLWILNLIVPALFGTFSMFHVNIAKAFGYENA
ncbi:MAG: flippase-like domain-containing protein [Saprospiraceae bacterium]|nr:flippase-like domain-containing protein [Saprospiraceae bacterium]